MQIKYCSYCVTSTCHHFRMWDQELNVLHDIITGCCNDIAICHYMFFTQWPNINILHTVGKSKCWVEKWLPPFRMGTTPSTTVQTLWGRSNNTRRLEVRKCGVCMFFVFFSGRIAVKRKTARTIFTQRPKISIFCPAWAIRCTDSCEIWHGRAARGSTWPCKISHQSVHGVGTRPQKLKISTFGKDST